MGNLATAVAETMHSQTGTTATHPATDRPRPATDSTSSCPLGKSILIRKTSLTKLGFKHLRKTGADMIRKSGGLEVSEAYLAHSEKTLARVYSNRDFDKLAAALGTMEAERAPVFA